MEILLLELKHSSLDLVIAFAFWGEKNKSRSDVTII